MAKEYIKGLIAANKDAVENINDLEVLVQNAKIENEKDKANFGNLCVALRGYRMVADATEALLINENVLQDEKGDFYQKIEDDEPEPEQNNNKEHE